MMVTFEGGCPICGSDVKGNPQDKYYCKKCNILYNDNDIKKDGNLPDGKVKRAGIKRESGWLYFIDKQGDVSRVEMARSRADKGRKEHQKILKAGVKKEKGYLYYLDKDGDIARSPMKRG